MKRFLIGACALALAATAAGAQTASESRIRVSKEGRMPAVTQIRYAPDDSLYIVEARGQRDWYRADMTTCAGVDVAEARNIQIRAELYNPATMISPEQAKLIALCAVPGLIGSGEMNTTNGRPEYAISILPKGKQTYSKVIVDAQTGAVLSTKQFGGLRGVAGWIRESAERENNKP